MGFLGKHPCVTKNVAFSLPDSPESLEFFCKQTRIGIIPTQKANPNISLIAMKQDYIDAQYVKLSYSVWPISIFYVLLCKLWQHFQVYVTRRDADHISWPFVKRDFDMLRITKSDCKPL